MRASSVGCFRHVLLSDVVYLINAAAGCHWELSALDPPEKRLNEGQVRFSNLKGC